MPFGGFLTVIHSLFDPKSSTKPSTVAFRGRNSSVLLVNCTDTDFERSLLARNAPPKIWCSVIRASRRVTLKYFITSRAAIAILCTVLRSLKPHHPRVTLSRLCRPAKFRIAPESINSKWWRISFQRNHPYELRQLLQQPPSSTTVLCRERTFLWTAFIVLNRNSFYLYRIIRLLSLP